MGKVKKGTIFKIFIITLLIILSTIGIVLSNLKEEQIELNDADKDTYYTYEADVELDKKPDWKAEDLLDKYKFLNHYVNETGKPLSDLLDKVCTQLWKRCEIICSQKVKPISDAVGYIAKTKYIEGSPAQSYILAQLENSAKGDDYYHREDPVQKAWWDLCTRLGVQESFREHSTGGVDASEGEFSLRLSSGDFSSDENPWDESFMSISPVTSVIKSEEELKTIVRTYADENNFDKANDWYDAIIHLVDAFGESNKTYASFKNANGEIDFKNLIGSINVYKRYIDALKEENITGNDYENQYKEFFSADISDAEKTAVINSNKVGQYLGDKYVICTDWTKDAKGKQYVLDGQKVEEIFKYTDSTYFKHGVDLNYTRRPNAYAQLMNKFDEKQLMQLYIYIIQEYSGVTFVGYDYQYDPANELLERAEKYEEFYDGLKESPKITLDTTDMQVNKSDNLNAFVVGPFTADYKFGGIVVNDKFELFGGITDFIVQTDKFIFNKDNQIKVGSTKVDADKKLTTNLENGEFALVTSVENIENNEKVGTTYLVCGDETYSYPQPGEEFYIVFNAGAGDTQITNISYKYDYLCNDSEYMYYELVYNGNDMQDLLEVYYAGLWYQEQEISIDMPIKTSIELNKQVMGPVPNRDEFYFDIYVEAKDSEESTEGLYEYKDTKYKYHTEAIAPADGTTVRVDLPEYYKKDYDEQPKVIAVEKDEFGKYYFDETWKDNKDSLWHEFTPNDDGIYECTDGKTITAVNTPIVEPYSIELIKRAPENPNGDTFYAKLDIFYRNGTVKTYIIPLTPTETELQYPIYRNIEPTKNGYYECKKYSEGNITEEFGVIQTGRDEEGYVYAKWNHTFEEYDNDFIWYLVSEVDENYTSYENSENISSSIWDKYEEPKYENRFAAINEGETEVAIITNTHKNKPVPIKLELSKQVVDSNGDPIEDDKTFAFEVQIKEDDFTKVRQTINVEATNPGEELKISTFNHELYLLNPNSKYTIRVEEKNVDGYKWSEIVQNLQQEGWKAEVDEDGKILYVFYELDNSMTEFSANFTNINTKLIKGNKFTITKTLKNKDGNDLSAGEIKKYFEEINQDGFVFRVETVRGKELLKSDFDESVQEYIVEENGNIYVTINAKNYATGISTKDISWKATELAPLYEIYEVDKHDNTYLQYIELGENRPTDSVWEDFRPSNGGHWTVDFFANDSEEVVVNATNIEGTIDKQLSITKEVEGTWDNKDEFYFRILSLDGKKTNIVENFFDEEHIAELKNGLKVVKITKENPTVYSKILTLSVLDELPDFWITEVDQYGNPWSEIPENEDSLWNHYTPEGYGTWTCHFTMHDEVLDFTLNAKNKSNVFTLKKEIVTNGEYTTEQFFEENPDAEFYFNLYDSEGCAVTNKYFDTTPIKTYDSRTVDAIVINKDNYTGIKSLPIAPAAGEKFILHEVFKTKEDENLYANTEEQFRWVIDFTENNNVEITAENIADMTLTIDKGVDDFLPDEKFYFKVFEGKEDVTNDLFGKDIVIIDYDIHQNGGETSRVIYGNHTYTVVEYDAEVNGKTYEEGKDTSDFWKKFTPSNNGKWEITLGDAKGPSFVKAINYLNNSIKIVKETEGDKDTEFGVSLMIWPTVNTNWMKIGGKEYTQYYYNDSIKVSANKPFILDEIQWSGAAPIYQVIELSSTLPSTWSLQGYKVNDTDLVSNPPVQSIIGGQENKIVIVNEEDDEVKIPVSKTIVDQFGKPTTLENDETFYFDIYVKPIEGAEYKENLVSAIALQEGYNPGNYSENGKYVRIETLEVTVPAGSTNANNVTDIITLPYDAEIDYKVVEVDKANGEGVAFKEYDSESESYWNKFEPTIFSNGKWGNKDGIWTGTLSNKNQVASVANVDAYNKVNKVTIDFEKLVVFEGKLQPIEEGEVFKFIVEYTSSLGREFEIETAEITPDNLKYIKTIELLRGEKVTYTITEVDPVKNTAYDPNDLTDFWKQFTPVDNGIITGTVDGSSANIPLIGVNIKNVHGWLVLVKEKADWLEHEKFYFEVYEGETNVTEKIFAAQNIVEVNGKKVIELNFNRREIYSLEQIWKSGTKAPTYTIKEVEYDSEIYTPDSETKTVTIPAIDIDTKLTADNAPTVAGYATFINKEVDYDKFEIKKVVKNSNGTAVSDDIFYAKVVDEENKNITETLFDGEDASAEIVELANGDKAVKLDKDTSAITENIIVTEKGKEYTVVEVDGDGYSYEEREKTDKKESVWNKGYKPENGTGKYEMTLMGQSNKSVLVASDITITNMIEDEPVKYTITKVVSDAEGNDITKATFEKGEHFYFKVTDSKGNNAINTLFGKDIITAKDGELIDLSLDQTSVTTIDVYTDEKYTVTETDEDGVAFGDYKKPEKEPENGWSVWEEYKPSDGKGIWELGKEQTSVIAENKLIKNNARILLSKQTTYEWPDDVGYKFKVYIKSANDKKEPEPIEVILKKNEPPFEFEVEWKEDEGAPSIKVVEVDLPEGVTYELKVAEETLQPGDYYKLPDVDGGSYTFACVNKAENKSANFELYKDALNNKVYNFKYEYGYYEDGNWKAITETKNLEAVANSNAPAISDTYTWDFGGNAPMFRVWEIDGNLKSIKATNAGETNAIEVDGHKGIEGALNPDVTVKIMAENGAEHKGELDLIKTFEVGKDDLLADLQWLAKEYKDKNIDSNKVTFKFNISISYDNKDSKFIIDDKEHNTWNKEVVWTLSQFIEVLNQKEADKTINILRGEGPIKVQWAGEAPNYNIDEIIYSNSFWAHERTISCSGKLQCICEGTENCLDQEETKCVVAEIINRYDWIIRPEITLLTSLAGDVWIETPEDDKTVKIDGIKNITDNEEISDKFASDVYVIPYRCIVDKDGNIVEKEKEENGVTKKEKIIQTNADKQFILTDEEYKYLTDKDNGHWEFADVYVPAFNLSDAEEKALYDAGCKVKYYIDFYYDGMKYEPTEHLVDGSAEDYLQLNEDYDKYFDNSVASENGNDRKDYNSKFARVAGKELYNNGKSTGVIKDANDTETATVDYTTNIAGTIDGSNVIRAISKGTVNMPINSTSSVAEIKANYMRASTKNLNLNYFFKPITLGDQVTELLEVKRTLGKDEEGREVMVYTEVYKEQFVPVDYAQHINLGLVQREQIDLSIDKKIESVSIIINEKAITYNYNNDGTFNENLQNSIAKFTTTIKENDELYTMLMEDNIENNKLFNVYTSDYYYRSAVYNETPVKDAYDTFMNALFKQKGTNPIKTKELQIFLTYSLTLSNNSGIYDARIDSIVDYYDSSLTFIDVDKGYGAYVSDDQIGVEEGLGSGLWAYIKQDEKEHKALTNIFANKSNYYDHTFDTTQITSKDEMADVKFKKMVISSTENEKILVPANTRTTYYLTYRADKEANLDDGIILGTKNNIAEIASFTPYMIANESTSTPAYTNYAAVIDKDSAPGNYNVSDEISRNIMEDDTDFANVAISGPSAENKIRSISGTAWLDKEDGSYTSDGQILGNSVKDENDYLISGLTTKLVEIIDLPKVDENGDITDNYVEYEFYWEGAETTTEKDGKYIIDKYVPASSINGSVERPGLVTGNYVVRFFYGNRDAEVYDKDGNLAAIETQINGVDYKTTAYQISEDNKAGYINNEWHNLFSENNTDNDARDNEARRLALIKETQVLDNSKTEMFNIANYKNSDEYASDMVGKYLSTVGIALNYDPNKSIEEWHDSLSKDTLNLIDTKTEEYKAEYEKYKADLQGEIEIANGQKAYNGIINATGYSMFADTAKLNLKVEYGFKELENNPISVKIEDVQSGDSATYSIENISLGLEERSRTNIYLDKQIKEITLTQNDGTEFFHVEYEIEYTTDEPGMLDTEWNKVAEGLYVKVSVKEDTLKGVEHLQKLDDKLSEQLVTNFIDGTVTTSQKNTQGIRYINIDSIKLQGLKLDIKYEITAINLSETDKYGEGLDKIMEGDKTFEDAIDELSSPDYVIDSNQNQLLFEDYNKDDDEVNYEPKAYGTYLGHIYYQGIEAENKSNDKVVKTTVRKVIDYIDNDIETDVTLLNENGAMWDDTPNSVEGLDNLVDDKAFVNGEIQDSFENPYKRILISTDSKEANSEFVKELEPGNAATIKVSTSKVFSGTDEGRTGMDNFAEILMIENTVGRRDIETVYGNYDPRGGATQITERDESSTELVTLSPPTGNIERDRQFITYITIILAIAVLAGAGVGIKLKISEKSKKSDKSE
ncbi:MAG: hypothetical protein J6J60_01140 [Clostridia bacterium]|nr:hypothetical protein [Clostridia bacterium]